MAVLLPHIFLVLGEATNSRSANTSCLTLAARRFQNLPKITQLVQESCRYARSNWQLAPSTYLHLAFRMYPEVENSAVLNSGVKPLHPAPKTEAWSGSSCPPSKARLPLFAWRATAATSCFRFGMTLRRSANPQLTPCHTSKLVWTAKTNSSIVTPACFNPTGSSNDEWLLPPLFVAGFAPLSHRHHLLAPFKLEQRWKLHVTLCLLAQFARRLKSPHISLLAGAATNHLTAIDTILWWHPSDETGRQRSINCNLCHEKCNSQLMFSILVVTSI